MKKNRNWVNLTYSFAEVLSDDGFQLSLKKAFTTPTNKGVFNSILKKLRKGRSSHPKVFCKKVKNLCQSLFVPESLF